jgi:hypothetical protein
MEIAELDRQAGSWAGHWRHQSWEGLAASASAAVYSRWHVAEEEPDSARRVQTLEVWLLPDLDCQSSRAAQPGRRCLEASRGLAHVRR